MTAKKTAAKKTAPKKTVAKKETAVSAPEPMDGPSRIEPAAVGTPAVNTSRQCWAIRTLVKEVEDLFPETPVEYGEVDLRNTALSVTFDLTGLDGDDSNSLANLLGLIESDTRVRDIVEDDSSVLVVMHSNARTQDSRAPFGLDDAYSVLSDLAEGESNDMFMDIPSDDYDEGSL